MTAAQPYQGRQPAIAAYLDLDFRRGVVTSGQGSKLTVNPPVVVARASSAMAFTPALTAIAANLPRLSINGADGSPAGLSIDPPSVRVTTNPDGFSAGWAFNAMTYLSAAVPSLRPGQKADLLLDTSANTSHFATQQKTVTGTVSRTACAVVKAQGRTEGALWMQRSATTFARVNFDLATGAVVATAGVGGAEPLGDGWFLVWVSGVNASAGAVDLILASRKDGLDSYIGNGSGFAVADLEFQTVDPGRPVPMLDVASRSVETASVLLADVGLALPSEATLFVDATLRGRSADQTLATVRGADGYSIRLTHLSDPGLGQFIGAAVVKNGVQTMAAYVFGSAFASRLRIAVSWSAAKITLAVQGLGVASAVGNASQTGMTRLDLGSIAGAAPLSGEIGRAILMPWLGTTALAALVGSEAAKGRPNLVQRANVGSGQMISLSSASGWSLALVGNGSTLIRTITVGPLKANTAYSLSFKARRTAGSGSVPISVDLFPDTLPERSFDIQSGAWTEFKWEGITSASSDMTLSTVQLRFFKASLPAGYTYEFTDIKLEEGATATPWTPALNDE